MEVTVYDGFWQPIVRISVLLNKTLLNTFSSLPAAWVGSLAMAGLLFFGPVAAKLNGRFGERAVATFGAIVCATGLLLTSQAPNITVMYVTFGGIVGFGSSCVFLAAFMIISRSFVKRRSFAMGLMSLGAPLGVALMSPVIQLLLDTLDWKRTFMSIAGIELLVCVLARSFDPNVKNVESNQVKCDENRESQDKTTTRGIVSSLMRNPMFLIVVFSTAISYLGHTIPYVHLVSVLNT